MEKPEFVYGNEKRFSEFVKSLESAKKIVAVSHLDLDGVASAKVVDYALQVDRVILSEYYASDNEDLLQRIKKEKPSHVIFTDLVIKKEFAEKVAKFAYVLVIDHHIHEQDYNSDKIFFLDSPESGMCASYLAYYLFSKISDLSKIDWLVACASISDFCYKSIWRWMESVCEKYGDKFRGGMIEGVDSGKIWDLQWKMVLGLLHFKNVEEGYKLIGLKFGDIGDLNKYYVSIQKEFDLFLKKFDSEKIKFNDGEFWEVNSESPIKSILVNYLSTKEQDKIFIFAKIKEEKYSLSARRQDGKVSVRDLLIKLVEGFEGASVGGHFKAAGGNIMLKDREKFLERLKNL
ncbi:MAG: DHHA1 domain-containing protein [Nanoarchaeota archaeon]